MEQNYEVRPDVINYDDIRKMAPALDGKPKLVNRLMRLLAIDKINALHAVSCNTPGVAAPQAMLRALGITLDVENREILDTLPKQGGFITVSNHPLGALDGIALIALIGQYRPDFKVMVNMILNYITSMRPNFIAVDALQSNDPAKRAVSVRGIAEALHHVKDGNALGFFPAGAVSKLRPNLRIIDRDWQPSVMRIITKAKVPVVPIYFHDRNGWFFNLLGVIDWRLRTLKLPSEVFRKRKTLRISIGKPILPEEIAAHTDDLATFLKDATYAMRH